jgi:hypothetical protein
MSDKSIEEVIELVNKLLYLAENPGANLNEAAVAKKKAEKLIKEYNLSKEDINHKKRTYPKQSKAKKPSGFKQTKFVSEEEYIYTQEQYDDVLDLYEKYKKYYYDQKEYSQYWKKSFDKASAHEDDMYNKYITLQNSTKFKLIYLIISSFFVFIFCIYLILRH